VVSRKHHLPNDDIFDERRVFDSGEISGPYSVGGIRLGSPICEDFWFEDVAETMQETGAEILLSPNGSPYARGKPDVRTQVMVQRSFDTELPLVYLNLVGGQDDQVFDGASFVLNQAGKLAVKLPQFEEATEVVHFERIDDKWIAKPGVKVACKVEMSQDYRAMAEGLKDYVLKSGFSKVVLGLSGGIDSALVAAIAVDALGGDNVMCIRLPSPISSTHSLDDAMNLIANLNCKFETISIQNCQDAVTRTLSKLFEGYKPDVTEENIQSRLRGLLLMALSNKFGSMLLTTGNKSEVAVGYSTIYGDMAGSYNPIKDLYKTRVFQTCKWRNKNYENWMKGKPGVIIPLEIIDKDPSAELRPDQRDEDSLPPYEVLDKILEGLIEKDLSVKDLISEGFDTKLIKKIENLIYNSEYKRYQSAPGVHLTGKSFWLGRRYPLVQDWRDPL
jgi:NAD+ synthase